MAYHGLRQEIKAIKEVKLPQKDQKLCLAVTETLSKQDMPSPKSVLTSMELRGELNLSLNLLFVRLKGHLGQLHAQFVVTCILCLVLVLDIGVHITVEKLLVIGIG